MGFWKQAAETDLERELRAQRPQPRDEFVQSLTVGIAPARPARRLSLPKVALVGAVTLVLAVSLGTAGALGAAGGSVRSFSVSVVHLVSPPKGASNSPDHVTTTTSSGGTVDYGNATPTHWPFQEQYGHMIPICWQGHIIYVTPRELIWYVFHGAKPARSCGSVPVNPHR